MLKEEAVKLYELKEAEFPNSEMLRELERVFLLKVIDRKWMDHIDDMDQLRQGIGLQAFAQRDPLVEYKRRETSTLRLPPYLKAPVPQLSHISAAPPALSFSDPLFLLLT